MISRLGSIITGIFRRTCPDPFVIAILLTLLTAVLCLFLTDANGPDKPFDPGTQVLWVVDAWVHTGTGFWKLLEFAMQMCLVLVTGHALAESPPVARMIRFLSRAPQTAAQAAVLVALTAGMAAISLNNRRNDRYNITRHSDIAQAILPISPRLRASACNIPILSRRPLTLRPIMITDMHIRMPSPLIPLRLQPIQQPHQRIRRPHLIHHLHLRLPAPITKLPHHHLPHPMPHTIPGIHLQ
jgi:hypothetical protein